MLVCAHNGLLHHVRVHNNVALTTLSVHIVAHAVMHEMFASSLVSILVPDTLNTLPAYWVAIIA